MRKGFVTSKQNFLLILASCALILILFNAFLAGAGKRAIETAEGYNADLSGYVYEDEKFAYVNEDNVALPDYVFDDEPVTQVLAAVSGEKWIEIDLSEQKIYAWEGNNLYLESLISTGLPYTPTPVGEYRIWIKLRATKMEGGSGSGYYYLPNVPYTMFFENEDVPGWKGYGLHGTYWHNDFGIPKSHGCVNLPTPIAKRIYDWASPMLQEGKGMVRSSGSNPGTRVVIHE